MNWFQEEPFPWLTVFQWCWFDRWNNMVTSSHTSEILKTGHVLSPKLKVTGRIAPWCGGLQCYHECLRKSLAVATGPDASDRHLENGELDCFGFFGRVFKGCLGATHLKTRWGWGFGVINVQVCIYIYTYIYIYICVCVYSIDRHTHTHHDHTCNGDGGGERDIYI